MVNRTHAVLIANDRSYFAILKKEVHSLVVSAGFSDRKIGEIDIIVAELVSNLVKHSGGGSLLVKLIEEEGLQGVELVAIDNGPGMTDITRMVADGVSTKNTLGQGLGAMKRLSQVFQVYSQKNWGTIILCRIFETDLPKFNKPPLCSVKTVIIPKTGESSCGDGFVSKSNKETIKLFLGDGLGHGPEAEKAIVTACDAFLKCEEESPSEIIRYINSHVKKTRGLVGTVAAYSVREKKWQLCGVGNISTLVRSPSNSRMYSSYNGIIGLNVPNTLKNQEVDREDEQVIIMCSDGIKSRWDGAQYPAIMRYDLTMLTAALLKDFARYTDDMSVAACKLN
jgi:anti-sigma regulatory factor (Ser/Thr protein kinase)